MVVGRALAAEMRSGTRSPKPAVNKVFLSLPRPALPPPVPLLPSPGWDPIRKASCPAEPHSAAGGGCGCQRPAKPRSTARPRAAPLAAAIPLGFSIYSRHHHRRLYFPYEAQTLP